MKKPILLLIVSGFAMVTAAQQKIPDHFTHRLAMPDYVRPVAAAANKGTGLYNTSWFIPYYLYNGFTSLVFEDSSGFKNVTLTYIWFDSTVRQRYSTGLGAINDLSFAQVIDPVSNSYLFDDPASGTTVNIRPIDSFSVDSVFVRAAYVTAPSRPASVVDTLILSVAPQTRNYYITKSMYSWISNYTTQDTLYGPAPTSVDSINRAAYSTTSGLRAIWKVPLDSSMRTPLDSMGNIIVKGFRFAVPNGGLGFHQNTHVSVTVTFKSGDTWTKNVDSITQFHRFAILSGYAAANSAMPYYWYDLGDRNGSSIMLSADTAFYDPAVYIEGFSAPGFNQEFHDIGIHAYCPFCFTGVADMSKTINSVQAVPNPAGNNVTVSVMLKTPADITVSLVNMLGQVVRTQYFGMARANEKKTATFSTADMAPGIYIYRATAGGQSESGRLAVIH